jgi:cystathionine beta-synthase
MIYKSILDTVGNTPIVELKKVIPKDSPHKFWAKLEYFNPGMSVKDRIALALVEGAEKRGELKPGGTIIEATSGNTGMGLALVAAVKGYKAIFIMPDKISEEKRAALRAFGAKVVITPTAVEPDDPRSYLSVSKKLAEITKGSFLTNQYHNPDNANVHYEKTGPEIWQQTEGKIDVFVAGAGTGGTISGTGRYLKEKNPNVKIMCPDPVGSILYDLFYYKEVKSPPQPYKVEGVGEDMLPDNVHMNVIDDFVQVTDMESFMMTRDIVAKEGICVGPSSAMALVGAIKYSETLKKPSNILVMMADSGRAYLSKAFNDDWLRDNEFLPSPMRLNRVSDLLKKRSKDVKVIFASVGQNVLQVVTLLKENGISQVPVFSDNELVGVLDETDLILPLATGKLKPTEPIIHLVKGSIVWVNENDTLETLSNHFQKGYVALLKDRDDKLFIITKIDLLEFMSEHLGE